MDMWREKMKKCKWFKDGDLIPDYAAFLCREKRLIDVIDHDDPRGGYDENVYAMGSIYEIHMLGEEAPQGVQGEIKETGNSSS